LASLKLGRRRGRAQGIGGGALKSVDAGEDGLRGSMQTIEDVDAELDLENMARTRV
jgi:hypothetical protein